MSKKNPRKVEIPVADHPVLRKLRAGRFRIKVVSTHDVDGSPAGESTAYVDEVMHIACVDGGKYNLSDKLRELASIIAATDSDFDTGTACIVVGRRYSSPALKRLAEPSDGQVFRVKPGE